MRKRERIIALGTIALVITLLSIGSLFLYWGVWNYFFGSHIGMMPSGMLILLGGILVIAGIIVVLKPVAFLLRRREGFYARAKTIFIMASIILLSIVTVVFVVAVYLSVPGYMAKYQDWLYWYLARTPGSIFFCMAIVLFCLWLNVISGVRSKLKDYGVSKPKDGKIRRGLRHVVEAVSAAFLFVSQYRPVLSFGFMAAPLTLYIIGIFWTLQKRGLFSVWVGMRAPMSLMDMLLFHNSHLMFGRIVAIVGFVIFLVAFVQFLRGRKGQITTGLYAVVRHPQYLGIITITLGISIMSVKFNRVMLAFWGMEIWYVWLIQVLGYVLLASYEEQHLLREYEIKYQQYAQKVSFIFPIPHIPRTLEPLVSILLALIIAFLCAQFL